MSLTSIISKLYFRPRWKELEHYKQGGAALQNEVLRYLISRGKETEYGQSHYFPMMKGYEDFAKFIPVNTYEELKGDIDRMRHGEKNILWPGEVKWYAKSSGTTNDKSKFIPVTPEGLKNLHYQGGGDVVALYLRNHPESHIFEGRSLILGGSHSPNYDLPNSLVGDLSAILIENINPLVNFIRVPKKETALISNFELKRDRIARETMNKNVTNISGVPSWMLSVLVRVLELSGKEHLEEVWPNLEVFFHGGIAFTPYRSQYERIITKPGMHYMETYNASEGFFGIQDDPTDASMLLMLDYGVFYEFLPMDELGSERPNIVPLEGVELGRNYAMLISTSCGLWRYEIGDTVQFTSRDPYKFIITGRTKYFINAFGEELIMDNAEKGLAYACEQTGAVVSEYTAAPRLHERRGQMPPPMAHRVCQGSRERPGLCRRPRQAAAGDQQRLRGKAIPRRDAPAAGDCGRKEGCLQRVAQAQGKTGWAAQGAPTLQQPQEHRRTAGAQRQRARGCRTSGVKGVSWVWKPT